MEQGTENAEIQSLFRASCAIIKIEITAGGVIPMDVQVGDILTMKKPHPCGSKQWKVLRTGMDFKLSCVGCGHEVMLPRSKVEKNIRSIAREGETIC